MMAYCRLQSMQSAVCNLQAAVCRLVEELGRIYNWIRMCSGGFSIGFWRVTGDLTFDSGWLGRIWHAVADCRLQFLQSAICKLPSG